ncbi:MAG TPA: radical SAM protein [Pyrinomonadaceae bacterium]|nr:radical SAM protein [Pyrinomonadaceae bacterium]
MEKPRAILKILHTINKRNLRESAADFRSVVLQPLTAPNLPRHLQIEIITRCNLECVMCPRTVALENASTAAQKKVWQRQMSIENFRHIIEEIPKIQTLSLHGIGEPLMHPHLFEMIEIAASVKIDVRFTTNATLLNSSKSEDLLKTGISRVIFSLDGATMETYEKIRIGAKFDKVIENIRRFLLLRKEFGQKNPIADINMVVTRQNYFEAEKMIELGAELGVDSIILSPMQPPEKELEENCCDSEMWHALAERAKQKAKTINIKLYLRGGIYESKKTFAEKQTHKCLHPWTTAVVTMDGEVMPCCNIHSKTFSMGNIFTRNFAELWNDTCYKNFRSELRQKGNVPLPCRWCPDF